LFATDAAAMMYSVKDTIVCAPTKPGTPKVVEDSAPILEMKSSYSDAVSGFTPELHMANNTASPGLRYASIAVSRYEALKSWSTEGARPSMTAAEASSAFLNSGMVVRMQSMTR